MKLAQQWKYELRPEPPPEGSDGWSYCYASTADIRAIQADALDAAIAAVKAQEELIFDRGVTKSTKVAIIKRIEALKANP